MVGSGSWTWQLPGVAPGSGADGLSRGWVPWRRWRGDGVPVAAVRARVVLACGWLAGGGQGADRGEDVREQVRAGARRMISCPPSWTRRAGVRMSVRRRVAIIALPPRTPCPSASSHHLVRPRPAPGRPRAARMGTIAAAHARAGDHHR